MLTLCLGKRFYLSICSDIEQYVAMKVKWYQHAKRAPLPCLALDMTYSLSHTERLKTTY